jgi:hypothetical protein
MIADANLHVISSDHRARASDQFMPALDQCNAKIRRREFLDDDRVGLPQATARIHGALLDEAGYAPLDDGGAAGALRQ